MHLSWISILALLFIQTAIGGGGTASAADGGWPEGYVIAEKSTSPNGHYGVLLPTREKAAEDEDENRNVLVNLQSHARLGVIRNAQLIEPVAAVLRHSNGDLF